MFFEFAGEAGFGDDAVDIVLVGTIEAVGGSNFCAMLGEKKTYAMVMAPKMTPIPIPMNGRAPTPWFHPLSSWNDIGYASKKRYRIP